jgi:hypothetical protein
MIYPALSGFEIIGQLKNSFRTLLLRVPVTHERREILRLIDIASDLKDVGRNQGHLSTRTKILEVRMGRDKRMQEEMVLRTENTMVRLLGVVPAAATNESEFP